MSIKFEDYMCDYIKTRIGVFKKYMLAALDNKDKCLWYLEASEGMIMPNSDLKNCELLRDAGIFREDTKVTRNGRNTYKVFFLTDNAKKIVKEIKTESTILEEDKLIDPMAHLA
ncbi:MAG: hypothetical protein FWG55_03580 [Candidatus Bathyarchaeota archaeon]|nr:hypothetical protein [Candidatus Termiticorpusculum sp.]